MINKPYISVTDFTAPEQVKMMEQAFAMSLGQSVGRRLGVGVMMSQKTLNGVETKWSKAFPPKEQVAGIFSACEKSLSYAVLHYADYDGVEVAENLERAASYGGRDMEAIQLDMTWPDPLVLAEFRARHPYVKLILQIGKRALDVVDRQPLQVVERVTAYGDAVDAVLLDLSMGSGTAMEPETLLPFARALQEFCPFVSLVVAGGLGPTSMALAEPLVLEFPDVSLDARGKLRPSGNALDPIEWRLATTYLQEAIKLVERHRKTPDERAAERKKNPWLAFKGYGYRLENLGRPAVFYIPVPKQAVEGVLPPAEVELREYLKKEFSAFSATLVPTFGFWVDGENKIWYDDCRQYEVAFVGADRIKPLVAELAKYAKAAGEKCLYFKAGEDACLIWPQD